MRTILHTLAIIALTVFAASAQSPSPGNTVVKLPQATVTFTVTNPYSGGYQGNVTIQNTSSQTLTNWGLSFSMPGQIVNIWNASLISQAGTNFSFNAAAYTWQSSIPVGGSASFGFMGAPSALTSPPTNFILTTSGSNPSQSPTPAPSATPKPSATPVPVPTATPVPSATPKPTATPSPAPTATPTPAPTATPKPSATPTPTPTPAPPASPSPTPSPTPGSTTATTVFPQATAVFSVTSEWSGGFNGQVVITNTSTQTLSNWKLSFKMAPVISTIWSANLVSQSGSTNTIDASLVPWNNTIAPGASVTFGFTASPSLNGTAPTGFTFTAQSGSSPSPTPNPTATPTPAPTATPKPSATPVPVPTATPNPTATPTPKPTATPVPTPVATPTPAPTATPSPTASPSPTPKPSPVSSTGYLSTKGNQIVDANGNNVVIRGVNWFGFETSNEVVHGLWQRDYHSFLDQVVSLGFNTLRIPFSQQMLAPGAATTSINFAANPDLQGLTPLQCLDKIINYAGSIGLKVYLDCHSAKADGYAGQDLWYLPGDSYYTEAQWISDWVKLATHYAGNPTVIGCDLKNEPKGSATWGTSSPSTDWNKAAERCGNAILAVNPHLLIIVEGIQNYNGSSYWDGGNLAGAGTYPVTLNLPNQVVYSPHDYPATVYNQTWFSAPNYPANLPSVWNNYWGYIFQNQQAPVLVGEFGSLLQTTSDQIWMKNLLAYMDGDFMLSGMSELAVGQKGISWTFWCLNPDSGDTGGILQNDWQTPDPVKMSYLKWSLAPLIGSPTGTGTSTPAPTPTPTPVASPTPTPAPVQSTAFNYAEAVQKSLYFYNCQKLGQLPTNFIVPWRGNAALADGNDNGIDLSGGFSDAGDHVKFGLPMASSMTLLAWGGIDNASGYQKSGQTKGLLDVVRWGTDYLIKCHPSDNVFYGQVGTGSADHAFWGPPEVMTMARPSFALTATKPGTEVAAESAAALAASSILFQSTDPSYAALLLSHAKTLFNFADSYRGTYTAAIPDAAAYYNSYSGYYDELVWGAAWLYRATGDTNYLNKAESLYSQYIAGQKLTWTHAWDDKSYGATVLLAELTGKSIYKTTAEDWLNYWTVGNSSGAKVAYTPGGLAWLDQWGSLRYAANTAFLAMIYADKVGDVGTRYHDFAKGQIDYMLGKNPSSRSYVVGFGNNPPINPHHRGAHGSWSGDIANPVNNRHVLYGALVGGPSSATDTSYTDDRSNYVCNEVALDYNAGFQGAVARLAQDSTGTPLALFPPASEAGTLGDQYFVQAAVNNSGAGFMEIRAVLNNRSAFPARGSTALSFRYYLDLSSLYAAGYDSTAITVTSNYIQNGTAAPALQVYDAARHIYFVNVDFSGTLIQPGTGTSYWREAQFRMNLRQGIPTTAWNPGSDPSYAGLMFGGNNLTTTSKIPVYENGTLLSGSNP